MGEDRKGGRKAWEKGGAATGPGNGCDGDAETSRQGPAGQWRTRVMSRRRRASRRYLI